MHRIAVRVLVCLGLAAAAASLSSEAFGADEASTSGGRWRLELQGLKALTEDHSDRNGDAFYTASAEYEWPLLQRCTLGLRLYPVFIYPGHGDTNFGAGAGFAARVYQNKGERNGLFAEGGISTLVTTHEFEHDNSQLNFLNEIGVGYQFPKNDWHVSVKFAHISNAGLGSDNRGINAVGLGLGYTF